MPETLPLLAGGVCGQRGELPHLGAIGAAGGARAARLSRAGSGACPGRAGRGCRRRAGIEVGGRRRCGWRWTFRAGRPEGKGAVRPAWPAMAADGFDHRAVVRRRRRPRGGGDPSWRHREHAPGDARGARGRRGSAGPDPRAPVVRGGARALLSMGGRGGGYSLSRQVGGALCRGGAGDGAAWRRAPGSSRMGQVSAACSGTAGGRATGVQTSPDGRRIDGQWMADRLDGRARSYDADGSLLSDQQWVMGKPEGKGWALLPDRSGRYEGNWQGWAARRGRVLILRDGRQDRGDRGGRAAWRGRSRRWRRSDKRRLRAITLSAADIIAALRPISARSVSCSRSRPWVTPAGMVAGCRVAASVAAVSRQPRGGWRDGTGMS
jgi:hypothetical protein